MMDEHATAPHGTASSADVTVAGARKMGGAADRSHQTLIINSPAADHDLLHDETEQRMMMLQVHDMMMMNMVGVQAAADQNSNSKKKDLVDDEDPADDDDDPFLRITYDHLLYANDDPDDSNHHHMHPHHHISFFFNPNPNPNPNPNMNICPSDNDSWLLPSPPPPPPPPPLPLRRDWSVSSSSSWLPPSHDPLLRPPFGAAATPSSGSAASSSAVINAAALRLSDITAALSPDDTPTSTATAIIPADTLTSNADQLQSICPSAAAAPPPSDRRQDPIPIIKSPAAAVPNRRKGGQNNNQLQLTNKTAAAAAAGAQERSNDNCAGVVTVQPPPPAAAVRRPAKYNTATTRAARNAADLEPGKKHEQTTAPDTTTTTESATNGRRSPDRSKTDVDPLEKTLRHVDDLLQRTSTALSSGGSFLLPGSHHRRSTAGRRIRKSTKPTKSTAPNNPFLNPPHLHLISSNPAVISANQKPAKPPISSYKRDIHIQSERQRRKGMTHLYATLHSLIVPGGRKIKTDRCSVLTETMKYIEVLLKQIDELKQKRLEIMTSTCKLLPLQKRRIASNVDDQDHNNIKIGDMPSQEEGNIDESIEVMNVEESLIDEWMCGAEEVDILEIHRGEEQDNEDIIIDNDRSGNTIGNKRKRHRNEILNNASEGEVIENINYMSIWDQVNGEVMNNNNNISHVLQGGVMSFDYKESLAENSNSDNEDDGGDYPNTEVGVRLYGGEAFITLRTLRMRDGLWSGILEILLDHHIDIINVNLSTSPDFDFHCIHAKVPSDIEIHCFDLQKLLKAFVSGEPRENKVHLTDGKYYM